MLGGREPHNKGMCVGCDCISQISFSNSGYVVAYLYMFTTWAVSAFKDCQPGLYWSQIRCIIKRMAVMAPELTLFCLFTEALHEKSCIKVGQESEALVGYQWVKILIKDNPAWSSSGTCSQVGQANGVGVGSK